MRTNNHVTCTIQEEDFSGSFMHSIHVLYVTMEKRLEYVLSTKDGLSFSQFLVIMPFASLSHPPSTQAKLAECLNITEATVSRHISSLVDKQFITKEHQEGNKKSYRLTITPEGRKAFTQARSIVDQEIQEAFAHIDSATQKKVTKLFLETVSLLQAKKQN